MKMVLLLIYAFVLNAKVNETVTQIWAALVTGKLSWQEEKVKKYTHTLVFRFFFNAFMFLLTYFFTTLMSNFIQTWAKTAVLWVGHCSALQP